MSWELPVLTTLILSVLGFWWIYSPRASYQKALLYAFLCSLTVLIDTRRLLEYFSPATIEALLDFRIHVLLIHHFKMVLTLGAVVWLLHRSWQTLWKPVPDLINILGVDVPEPPDVSLAGIRSDAATLSWTRPASNRPVQKYTIQVNGVHVGDSPGNEVAITVTGLKPDHFYNIRVVAVGPNNFQAGSKVLRLRTFGKDGRPQLGNSRLPTSFANNDHPHPKNGDEDDDSDSQKKPPVPTVEAAPVLDGNNASTSDVTATVPSQRRNTVNRRHSPSVASMDQPQIKLPLVDGPELSLDELNRRFESTRKEVDETLAQYAKEEAELQQQEEELKQEKETKRQALKEKEEQTAQLKANVRTTMEQMRAAEKDRAKKEQQLKDKENKKSKVRDTATKLENDIERMKKEREGFEAQKKELAAKRDRDGQDLDDSNAELQENCAELEAELKEKGKQLQDLKATREELPGADDEQWKENDIIVRKEWDARRKELHNQLVAETKKQHNLDQQIRYLREELQHMGLYYNNQPDPTAMEFEPSGAPQDPRDSGNFDSLSHLNSPPHNQFGPPDDSFSGFSRAGFGQILFMDHNAADNADDHQSEADFRANAGPLSPTAHSLIPSGIFDETFEDAAEHLPNQYLPESVTAAEEDHPQSPLSSDGRSLNMFSSPHGSSHNLPFPQYNDMDSQSLNINSSPQQPPLPSGHRLSSLLSNFQRSRGPKPADVEGPAIGSLKAGQSQSFPRSTDDHDMPGNKRRISFSWMNRHSGAEPSRTSMGPTSRPFSARRLNPFASSAGALTGENESPDSRPASIASTDLPRPSTDSGSIWNIPGDFSMLAKNRVWSPNEGRWSSRNPSRRPSLGAAPTVLETTLATANDEILDDDDLLNPQTSPSQVGVIGSRPPSHRASMSRNLNPAAPTFRTPSFFSRRDRDASPDRGLKGREKRGKSKEGRTKGLEALTPTIEVPPNLDDSPTSPRMSRDAHSVHTQNSVSESHESLDLGMTASNSTTDNNTASHKDADSSVVKKLFRKGSSSKFSTLSSRLSKDSVLFKKGPGSSTFSEKNMSEHRSSIGDADDLEEDMAQLGRSYDSMASSPSIGQGSFRSKDAPKEGRMGTWRFSMKKKNKEPAAKEKESMENDGLVDE
ncbi:unnamed protein product [Fusarium graminearum]|nr:unnamed protein product [Fusarium graminearum]